MSLVPGSQIEIINPHIERGQIRYALFDFDGTLSLIREGWQSVMISMMIELLLETPGAEDEEALQDIVTEFVTDLTGKQTIYQMIRLAEEIKARGGTPLPALKYKHIYHDRLWERIKERVNALESGAAVPAQMLVPGSIDMLEGIRARDVCCYLASGTDERYVLHEASLLGLTEYFVGVYGALDDYKRFSKHMVIQRIISENGLSGSELVAFGDGYVEIEDTHSVGGIAIGVATNEAKRQGIDAWKRERLIQAGADLIIPDFREHETVLAYLFADDGA